MAVRACLCRLRIRHGRQKRGAVELASSQQALWAYAGHQEHQCYARHQGGKARAQHLRGRVRGSAVKGCQSKAFQSAGLCWDF